MDRRTPSSSQRSALRGAARRPLHCAIACLFLPAALILLTAHPAAARGRQSDTVAASVTPLIGSDYHPAVQKALNHARKSIRCAMYLASYKPEYPRGPEALLLRALIDASKRGVKVTVILDHSGPPAKRTDKSFPSDTKNDAAFAFLEKNGVDVSYDTDDVTLHSKLIIVDDTVTILGSTNWTYSALRKNHESSVIIRSSEIAREFAGSFDRIEKIERRR